MAVDMPVAMARPTKLHDLKTWPAEFSEVTTGRKTFEWRLNDRDFLPGDLLLLREWEPTAESYTGRVVLRKITQMSDGHREPFEGIPDGYAILSIQPALDDHPVRWLQMTTGSVYSPAPPHPESALHWNEAPTKGSDHD